MSNFDPSVLQSPLEWALAYAQMGWPVFPVQPRGKAPLTSHGFKDATTDSRTIRDWWTRWPEANIGIPTGAGSGLAVLDIDQPGGQESLQRYLQKYGPLPGTVQSLTGGGGRQVFFKFEEGFRNSAGQWGGNLDTRGEGGYVVVPPSVHPRGVPYRWEPGHAPGAVELAPLPGWLRPAGVALRAIMPTPRIVPEPQSAVAPRSGNLGGIFDAASVRLTADGSPALPGTRNVTAASLTGQYISQGDSPEAALEKLQAWNQSIPVPLPEPELKHIVASVVRTHLRNHPGALVPIRQIIEPVAAAQAFLPSETPTPAPQIPSHLLQAPGLLGEIVQWILATAYKPQPLLSLANAIAFVGAVVGRKVQTPSRLRTNFYCLGVGDSGCGKDHSRKAIKAISAAAGLADQILGGEDVSSDSAILAAVYEHPSILFQFDEIGHMIANNASRNAQVHQRAIAPMLTKLFSSANTLYLGKEYAGRTDKRKDIDQPNVCIYGTTVPSRLYEGLTPGEISDGFLGRMLVFQSEDPDPEPQDVEWEEPPGVIVQQVRAWHGRSDLPRAPGNIASVTQHIPITVPYSPEAKSGLKQFEHRCRTLKAQTRRENGLDVLWSRATEHAVKIALVAACGCDYDAREISGDVMAWAIELAEYLTTALIQTVSQSIAGSMFERELLYVQRQIAAAGAVGISHSDLVRRTRRLAPRARTEILGELIQSGAILRMEHKPPRGSSFMIYRIAKAAAGPSDPQPPSEK